MKKACIIALVVLWSVVFAVQGICQDNKQEAAGLAGSAAGLGSKPRPARAAKGRSNSFAGVLVGLDTADKTISIRGRGKTVTFDASNPVLKPGQKLEDFRMGSYIAVSYTSNGIRITRSSKKEAGSPEICEAPAPGGRVARSKAPRVRTKGTGFLDVDENKDGKITPVELSVVLGSLTMEQFRTYDRNGDGCLSETEYRAVPR